MNTASTQGVETDTDDIDYTSFSKDLRDRFARRAETPEPFFTTDAEGLFDAFLQGLPAHRRQHYTCNACRRFVDRYGGLVTIDEDGNKLSVLWHRRQDFFSDAVVNVHNRVMDAKVDGVFLSDEKTWGLPGNRDPERGRYWTHFHVVPPEARIFKCPPLKTVGQVMAEKREDFGMLSRGVAEFPVDIVRTAYTALKAGQLYRAEKAESVAKFLLDLHELVGNVTGDRRDNIIWRAVALAPPGFAHVKSSMIGTLLEDIQSGMPFDAVARRWKEKMDPLQYQRPQAAPKDGAIDRAEKIVAELGLARSLERRYARLSDLGEKLWTPHELPKDPDGKGGVFNHLRSSRRPKTSYVDMPATVMTWAKFEREVLPTAEFIETFVPWGSLSLASLVTAVHADAPPILQWDPSEGVRNPVSWFFYSRAGIAADWRLRSNEFFPVSAVTRYPHMWHGRAHEFAHHGRGVFFFIEGAHDTRDGGGACLFPEFLKGELREVRSVIEAYSKGAKIADPELGECTGFALKEGDNSKRNVELRVYSGKTRVRYILDRWD